MERDLPTPFVAAADTLKTEAYEYSWYQVLRKLAREQADGEEVDSDFDAKAG